MKKASPFALFVLAATPVVAHPGTAREHETLDAIAHLVLSALPAVFAAGLMGVVAYAHLRKT